MLTRSEVAKLLGKSVATVRRMEGRELHPQVDSEGVHLFDPAEVEDMVEAQRSSTLAIVSSHTSDWRDWLDETLTQRKRETEQRAEEEQRRQTAEAARRERAEREQMERDRERAATEERTRRDELRVEAYEFVAGLSPREFRRLSREPGFAAFLAELDAD